MIINERFKFAIKENCVEKLGFIKIRKVWQDVLIDLINYKSKIVNKLQSVILKKLLLVLCFEIIIEVVAMIRLMKFREQRRALCNRQSWLQKFKQNYEFTKTQLDKAANPIVKTMALPSTNTNLV